MTATWLRDADGKLINLAHVQQITVRHSGFDINSKVQLGDEAYHIEASYGFGHDHHRGVLARGFETEEAAQQFLDQKISPLVEALGVTP